MVHIPLTRVTATAAAPWVERLARFGYAAKGVVYIAVGVLAARAAVGVSSAPEGSSDALSSIDRQPFGQAVLALVAVGLVGYVVWRFVQATRDPEGKGSDPKGLAQRAGYFLSGLLYGGLAIEAGRRALGAVTRGSDDGAEQWTARALDVPFGTAAVFVAGVGLVGYGLFQLYRGASGDLAKRLAVEKLDARECRIVVSVGRAGLIARGVVLVLSGVFVVRAALESDPDEAQGLGGALRALEGAPYGPWLLGLVAAGLAAYGAFELVRARYGRIRAA